MHQGMAVRIYMLNYGYLSTSVDGGLTTDVDVEVTKSGHEFVLYYPLIKWLIARHPASMRWKTPPDQM